MSFLCYDIRHVYSKLHINSDCGYVLCHYWNIATTSGFWRPASGLAGGRISKVARRHSPSEEVFLAFDRRSHPARTDDAGSTRMVHFNGDLSSRDGIRKMLQNNWPRRIGRVSLQWERERTGWWTTARGGVGCLKGYCRRGNNVGQVRDTSAWIRTSNVSEEITS